ncbi:toll/interleukin-1 receptor domain-containing protein [Streptomyces sp. NPDC021020]|uniref:toll/interleukin-1 receptor domain-containing protein n=1 Tax=Streptomyces sp. NPDC021020 TaxID=3365109 RepID=UPI0037A4DB62
MPRIFVSFRKVDNRWMRDRVYQALADMFGAGEIFKSGESIPPGGDFAAILRRQAAECEVMLVLIGTGWSDARDAGGGRLLDRGDDWVRVEIATALAAGNRVIPVLLGDAAMLPAPVALPEDIAELAHLQFLRVPETHLEEGLRRFVTSLSGLVPDLPTSGSGGNEPAAPPADPLPTAAPVTQNTGGGNAVSVHGGAKNARVAGGDIRETKIKTGGIFATAATFLTSRTGIATAAAAAVTAGVVVTVAVTTGGTGDAGARTPATATGADTALRAAHPATKSQGVTLGDLTSGFMTLPNGWQACSENDPYSAVQAGDDCSADPAIGDPLAGASLRIEMTGYSDPAECVAHGWSSSRTAGVDVPSATSDHLTSLKPNAHIYAGYTTIPDGNPWEVVLCMSLPQVEPTEPGDTCFEIVQLLGNSAPMETQEPALWEAARTIRLGSSRACS